MIDSIYSNSCVQNPVSFTKQDTTSQQTESVQKSGDSISLSESGRLLSKVTGGGTTLSITLEDLEAELEQVLAEMQGKTTALFLENDISLDPPVELTTDSNGAVRVVGDHPDKEKIEQLFEDNPELANEMRRAGGLSSLIEAGKEHLAFASEYREDPYAAVAKYGDLLFDNMPEEPWSMVVGEEAA